MINKNGLCSMFRNISKESVKYSIINCMELFTDHSKVQFIELHTARRSSTPHKQNQNDNTATRYVGEYIRGIDTVYLPRSEIQSKNWLIQP